MATFALAEEAIDSEIIKNFEFFSQMDMIQNMDLVTHLDVLSDEKVNSKDGAKDPGTGVQNPMPTKPKG